MQCPPEIANFFLAMQAGAAGEAQLGACFAEDAVYTEPFSGSGEMRRHEGRAAVIRAMSVGWEGPMALRDPVLRIDRVETSGDRIDLDWTCASPSIPGGTGRGRNVYRMKDGLIVELVTTLEAP